MCGCAAVTCRQKPLTLVKSRATGSASGRSVHSLPDGARDTRPDNIKWRHLMPRIPPFPATLSGTDVRFEKWRMQFCIAYHCSDSAMILFPAYNVLRNFPPPSCCILQCPSDLSRSLGPFYALRAAAHTGRIAVDTPQQAQVPHQLSKSGFEKWRAREDSNSRPPDS